VQRGLRFKPQTIKERIHSAFKAPENFALETRNSKSETPTVENAGQFRELLRMQRALNGRIGMHTEDRADLKHIQS
jgi:hypothetical protein